MIKKRLENIFKKNFKNYKTKKNFNKIGMDDIKGWDSIGHVNLMLKIEKEFKIKLTTTDFFKFTTVSKILQRLKK